jgi:hypothetical protein
LSDIRENKDAEIKIYMCEIEYSWLLIINFDSELKEYNLSFLQSESRFEKDLQ